MAWIGVRAQSISFGIKAGLNLTELPATASGVSVTNNYLVGFHAGGLVDIKFGSFSIQPGILFTTKGGKSAYTLTEDLSGATLTATGNSTTTLNYIEVPVNFLYRMEAGDGNVFFGAGPYVGYGLSGKLVGDATAVGTTSHIDQSIKFGNSDGDVKNPDVGINGLVGYQLNNGLTVSAGYGYGLIDTSSAGANVKNQGFSFSVGFFFQ